MPRLSLDWRLYWRLYCACCSHLLHLLRVVMFIADNFSRNKQLHPGYLLVLPIAILRLTQFGINVNVVRLVRFIHIAFSIHAMTSGVKDVP